MYREGWHFLPGDGALRFSDGRIPKLGERLRFSTTPFRRATPQVRLVGMHAISQADPECAPIASPLLCRVILDGMDGGEEVIPDDYERENVLMCAEFRTILWGPVDIRLITGWDRLSPELIADEAWRLWVNREKGATDE